MTRHETYSYRGLIAILALFPLAVLTMAVPELVVAVGLGALTALAFRRIWPAVRAYSRTDPPATPARR